MATIGAFAFILDNAHRVLCVRLNYGHKGWTTPGGRVEPGESPATALKREVREETGYDVEIGALIGVYSKPYQDDIVLGFEARITGRNAWEPTSEIADVRFFPKQELPDGFSAVARKRIEDGFRGVRGAFHEFGSAE